MTEQHADTSVLFVSSRGNADADGSIERPYDSLDRALAAIQDQSERQNGDHVVPDLKIVCIERPGGKLRPVGPARYRFFIDPYQSGDAPDGSEAAPWKSLDQAARELAVLHRDGRLTLQPGEHLALARHKVFAATPIERKKKRTEWIAQSIFCVMAFSLVAPVVAILAYLTYQAWPALTAEFLFSNPVEMGRAGGIWAPLVGTFMLVLVTMLLATPIGVLAGVYLNEYAPDNWVTRIVNLAVVNLAGVPSIVHGLFGFGAFVMFAGIGKSVFAASCTLAVMTLPVIITSTREALASVPRNFREACWNMGATRWQTIRTVVLPNSISGMLTGVILQVSRAAGETAPILFTGAAIFLPVPESGWESFLPFGLDQPFMALSMHLFTVRTQIANVPESMQFATAVVLIGLVLAVNSASIAFRVYLRSRKKW